MLIQSINRTDKGEMWAKSHEKDNQVKADIIIILNFLNERCGVKPYRWRRRQQGQGRLKNIRDSDFYVCMCVSVTGMGTCMLLIVVYYYGM